MYFVVLTFFYLSFALFRVIFKNTEVDPKINPALWSIWDPGDNRTDNVFFADYNTTGSGITTITRPSFATTLTASQAQAYSISSAVGSNYSSWVDMDYFV
jgi:pectinesterase